MMLRDSERALIYPACYCTLGVKDTALSGNRSRVTCVYCKGANWVYADPVNVLCTVSGYNDSLDHADIATFSPGDLTMSLRPNEKITVSRGDKILLPRIGGGFPYPGELIQHTANEYDVAQWPIARVNVCSITREEGVTFYQVGTDFTVDGHTITWNPNTLGIGDIYFLKYDAHPEFVAEPSLYARYDRGQPMGQKVFLRRRQVTMDPNLFTNPLFKIQ